MAGKSIVFREQLDTPENRSAPRILQANAEGKLNIGSQWTFQSHRAGWPVVLDKLSTLHHPAGLLFDGFVDQNFGWYRKNAMGVGEIPYTTPWLGFLHNPPGMPGFFERLACPEVYLESYPMRHSLPYCQGLFVFSNYLADWLRDRVECPVEALWHPTTVPDVRFHWDHYIANQDKKIVQLGFWLRRIKSLKHLHAPGFTKVWLVAHDYARQIQYLEEMATDNFDQYGLEVIGDYEEWERLSDPEYDYLLSKNIAFLDLYDASANNAVIECIARNTPLLVRRLPAVVEYLGESYPFYFDSLEEASQKVGNQDLVHDTYQYLVRMNKDHLGPENFVSSVVDSSLYQGLPAPGATSFFTGAGPRVDTIENLHMVKGESLATDFVVVVAFRNQEGKLQRCLESVATHCLGSYDVGIVLVDDASVDDALDQGMAYLDSLGIPYVAVRNPDRKWYARNLYNAVNLLVSRDDAIILEVDGDDYLENTRVMDHLQAEYDDGALKTFGSFRLAPGSSDIFGMDDLSDPRQVAVISEPWNLECCMPWMPLRTYRKSLFMDVPLHYFLERSGGSWLKTAEDLSVHPIMTALAGDKAHFMDQVLYVYDNSGLHHDHNLLDRHRYIVENLFRLPTGKLIGEYCASVRNENFGISDGGRVGPRIESPKPVDVARISDRQKRLPS